MKGGGTAGRRGAQMGICFICHIFRESTFAFRPLSGKTKGNLKSLSKRAKPLAFCGIYGRM